MEKSSKKNRLVKIFVPVLIVIIIAGIYLFKNMPEENAPEQQLSNSKEDTNINNKDDDANGIDYSSSKFDLDATNSFDLDEIRSYGLPVLVDFGSDSCYYCVMMEPLLEELNQELRGKAIIKFVDVNNNSTVADGFPLMGIPTQFFFDKEGNPFVPDENSEAYMTHLEGKQFIMYTTEEDQHVLTAHPGFMDKEQMIAVLKEMGLE